ncbi:preprotein translocase subunit SecG [Taibaiella lutea]|uniref:Protein-export membrane protein SecG n=1 Tax=Taibaiella lutea TaxID=2608001 RepID=A0A5M6CHQ7_9BACT|nr:preprotein translocase subunit SecG [Taibaiella lutea]KAA5534748.1 preprotein translocase subunit SecG [Taibaiella lutea]
MTSVLIIVILVACVVLGFFVLVQKPKGGGLSGSFGSIGSQVMGVKQSGDVMEKGTWYTMAIIAVLCVGTVFTLDIVSPEKAAKQEQQQQQGQQGAGQQQGGAQQNAPQGAGK